MATLIAGVIVGGCTLVAIVLDHYLHHRGTGYSSRQGLFSRGRNARVCLTTLVAFVVMELVAKFAVRADSDASELLLKATAATFLVFLLSAISLAVRMLADP